MAAPDRFELPKANELEGITWLGDTLVANFTGITGNRVDRPDISVPVARKPITTGSIFRAYPVNADAYHI